MRGFEELATNVAKLDRVERYVLCRALQNIHRQLCAVLRVDIPINEILVAEIGATPPPDASDEAITKRVLHKINFLAGEVLHPMLGDTDDDGFAVKALMTDTKLAASDSEPRTIKRLGHRDPRKMDFTQKFDADVAVGLAHFIAGRMEFEGKTAAEKVLSRIGYGLSYSGFRPLEQRLPEKHRARMRRAGRLSLNNAGLPPEEMTDLSPAERKILLIEEFFGEGETGPDDLADPAWTATLVGYLKRLLNRVRGVSR
jgi:hypothetical protein